MKFWIRKLIMEKGQIAIYKLTGERVKIVSAGHFPDTIFVEFESSKKGELSRKVEVYVTQIQAIPI